MQLPLLTRAPVAAHKDVSAPLELRLRRNRQRRRRALIRRFATLACWSAGLLGAGAFVFALTLGAAQGLSLIHI